MTVVDPNETFAPNSAATGIGRLLSALQGLTTSPTSTTSPTDPFTNPTPSPTATSPTSPTDTTTPTTGSSDPVPQGTAISQGYGGANGHPGIDLAVPDGTKIAAAISGTVTHAANDDPGGYGQWVEITAPDGTVTRYGHLSGLDVKAGTAVKAGQVIGTSGGRPGETGAGNASGPHLHFEVRQGGQTVDPTPWLAGGSSIVKADPSQVSATQVAPAPTRDPQDVVDTSINKLTDTLAGKPTQPESQPTQQTPQSATTTGADNDPNAINAFLNATKQHESGGDYTIRNQSGLSNASGAYQFIGSTWGGYGGYASAAEAPPAVQDAKAREMATALFDKYHSWKLVAAAWYGGPGIADQIAAGKNPGSPQGQGSYLAYMNTIGQLMSGAKNG